MTAASPAPGYPVAVPDFVEAVEGWRVWRVGRRVGGVVLESLFTPTTWEPLTPLSATCVSKLRPAWRRWQLRKQHHAAPELACTCGVYGAASEAVAREYLMVRRFVPRGERVIGRVALWGDVVECTNGWRASLAYPVELLIAAPDELLAGEGAESLDEIALGLRAYSVPVKLFAVPSAARVGT